MKKLLGLLLICATTTSFGQSADSLWAPLPLTVKWGIEKLYPDTTNGDLYMMGGLELVNGQPCNLVKWDGTNATLIPSRFDHVYAAVKYKGKIVVSAYINNLLGYSSFIATYGSGGWSYIDSFKLSSGLGAVRPLDSNL